jgi:MFS family permease
VTQASRPLPLLGGLYTVQGVVAGFTTSMLLPWLAAKGVSLEEQTGLLALASLPWLLKLPVAGMLDRWRPSAARVAAGAMLVMAGLVGALAWSGDDLATLGWLGPAWLVLNALLAAQDVSADAIALDTVEAETRGRANGVMQGALAIGSTVLGGYGLGAVLVRRGLGDTLWVLAAVLAVAAMWTFRSRVQTAVRSAAGGAMAVLRMRSTWAIGAVVSVLLAADVLTSALSGAFFVQRIGWSLERIQAVLPWAGLAAQVVGFVGAALLVDRVGHARAAAGGCIALGLSTLGFATVPGAWPSVAFIVGFTLVQGAAMSVMIVGLHAWLMGRVEPSVRATHYAVFVSLLNVPRAWVPGVAADLLEALGWSGVFVVSGATQLVVAAAFVWVARRYG